MADKMKILIVNTVQTGKNGITNVIFNYLNSLDSDSIIFDMLSLNQPDHIYVSFIERKGGHLFVLSRKDGALKYWIGLRNLISRNKYDAVHIHGNSHTVVLELSAALFANCKNRIVHAHNTQTDYPLFHKYSTPLFKLLVTHRFSCGIDAGKWMFGTSSFTVINNGIDIEKFHFNPEKRILVRNENNWNQNRKVIGHVGYFEKVKNQEWVISVFSELYKTDNTYRLLLIGDGVQRDDMQQLVRKLNLSDVVRFTGNIDNVEDYLNAMDLVMMPSLYEGLPLTLIEQQVNGLRCFVSENITRESDKTGNLSFLSLSLPVSEWADTIRKVSIDDELARLSRSEDAIKAITACGYNIKQEAMKLLEFYKKL